MTANKRFWIRPSPSFADVCAGCGHLYGMHNGTRCPVDVEAHFEAPDLAPQETGAAS